MTAIEVGIGQWAQDPGYGGSFPIDEFAPMPAEQSLEDRARDFFTLSGSVVSPTADCQRWEVPGTGEYIPAQTAKEISLEVRRGVGSNALTARS